MVGVACTLSRGEATRAQRTWRRCRRKRRRGTGGRGGRGRVAIGADSRVPRPRGGRLAARRETGVSEPGEGRKRERERASAREREKETDREGERRKSAPNMQQEKKNWRSIGSSW